MKPGRPVLWLTLGIALAAAAAALTGIFSRAGSGSYAYTSIRGYEITIYGKGLYRHMSAEVAIQGIAQDYVTLLVAIPLLLFAFYKASTGTVKWNFIFAGVTGYFLVTYMFYLVMGMYNALFLVYVFLAGAAFFLFVNRISAIAVQNVSDYFSTTTPVKSTGGFLIFNAVCIALLWLGVVVPPLLDGTIIPVQVEHYTTLIVQGLDLAILLPACLMIGIWLLQKKPLGYKWAPIYFVFLSLLMTALTAKVVAMALQGYSVVPVIFIIPSINLATLFCTFLLFKNMNDHATASAK